MKPELNEHKGFSTKNFELDFALEQQIRSIPNMTRDDLIDFVGLLAQNNRDVHGVLANFRGIAEEQSKMIDKLIFLLQGRR